MTHSGAEAAICPRDHVLPSNHTRVLQQALGYQLRMLDEVTGVSHDSGKQNFASRQLDVLPNLPFVIVARIGRLN